MGGLSGTAARGERARRDAARRTGRGGAGAHRRAGARLLREGGGRALSGDAARSRGDHRPRARQRHDPPGGRPRHRLRRDRAAADRRGAGGAASGLARRGCRAGRGGAGGRRRRSRDRVHAGPDGQPGRGLGGACRARPPAAASRGGDLGVRLRDRDLSHGVHGVVVRRAAAWHLPVGRGCTHRPRGRRLRDAPDRSGVGAAHRARVARCPRRRHRAASHPARRAAALPAVRRRRRRHRAAVPARGGTGPVTWEGLAALGIMGVAAPAVPGIAVKTKSLLTGRRGAPVLQLYYDLWKLLRKGTVYSRTTTWVFRAGPSVVLASLIVATLFLPLDGRASPAGFAGDLVAFAGLLALGRFALVLAGRDTGSSFEGMGASREVTIASFAEATLLLCFIALVHSTGEISLGGMLGTPLAVAWPRAGASLSLVGISLFVLLLAENSRVPVDDPATHLELTMIHEVIVLDHSGPDFALILYAGALKLALFGGLVVVVFLPLAGFSRPLALALLFAGLAVVAVAVCVVESIMARHPLARVPPLLVGAAVLASFGIILQVH